MLNKIFGAEGEKKVKKHCEKVLGYKVIGMNIDCGKFGEIDIAALDNAQYVFIEVKSRKNNRYMDIYEQVNKRKKEALLRAAKFYILKNNLEDAGYRIDLATYNEEKDKIEYYTDIINDI